jgi:hypothetical protein
VLIWLPSFSSDWCYEPRLKGTPLVSTFPAETKDRGQLLPDRAVGNPLLSRLVIRAGTRGRLQQPFRATSIKCL